MIPHVQELQDDMQWNSNYQIFQVGGIAITCSQTDVHILEMPVCGSLMLSRTQNRWGKSKKKIC